MKKISKIVILFSAVYLLCLQLLFGLHSLQHEEEGISHHDKDYPSTVEASACGLCDLFFDQTIEAVPPGQEIIFCFCNHLISPGGDQDSFSGSYSTLLRGPPALIS